MVVAGLRAASTGQVVTPDPMPFPYRAVLFDLDGTLYRGDEPIPGAVETDRALRARGVRVRYVTNNATLGREEFAAKLRRLGFPAEPGDVYSSATGTASYLVEEGLREAFVVGMPGLVQTLRTAGVKVVNADEEGVVGPTPAAGDAVVVGLCRTFTYPLLDGAMNAVLAGARLVATNPDATFPLEGGRFAPGAGSLVAAVKTCSGVEPFVVGKPQPYLVRTILEDAGLRPEEALVVGDREDTDIACGLAAGCPTFLVLSGVARQIPQGQPGGPDVTALLNL